MATEDQLKRMYQKCSRGARDIPHIELTPQPLRDDNGQYARLIVDGAPRRQYPTRVALVDHTGTKAYLASLDTKKPLPSGPAAGSNPYQWVEGPVVDPLADLPAPTPGFWDTPVV